MAVLVEGISIIVRKDTIVKKIRGGWEKFLTLIPNRTLCFDDNLVRVGFMDPMGLEGFSNKLLTHGLIFFEKRNFVDYAVVDQREGPTANCDWLKFSHITFFDPPMTVAVCEYVCHGKEKKTPGDNSIQVAFPVDWNYESSLSKKYQFIPTEEMPTRMKLLRHENGLDVYLDMATGKEMYIGKTN